jgi:acetylornithine deacetylase
MIVGEPTGLRPVAAHKGALRHRITVGGVAAHSSTPDCGANAIHAAAEFIVEAERAVAALGGGSGPTIEPGAPSFSAGIIHGGNQVNRIPDRVVVETDFRLPPGMEAVAAELIFTRAAEAVAARRSRITFAQERTQDYPPFAMALDSTFLKVIEPLAANGWHEPVCYATDAGYFAAAGIPCVVFGPGDIARAHTADEWIELDQVENGAVLLGECIAKGHPMTPVILY